MLHTVTLGGHPLADLDTLIAHASLSIRTFGMFEELPAGWKLMQNDAPLPEPTWYAQIDHARRSVSLLNSMPEAELPAVLAALSVAIVAGEKEAGRYVARAS